MKKTRFYWLTLLVFLMAAAITCWCFEEKIVAIGQKIENIEK